jgi:hypothetical protein
MDSNAHFPDPKLAASVEHGLCNALCWLDLNLYDRYEKGKTPTEVLIYASFWFALNPVSKFS